MRKFSRWMPAAEKDDSPLGWLFCIWLWAAFWPFLLPAHLSHRRYLRGLANDRSGEDIGTFARAFDRRSEPFDPWVVRATWDALGLYVSFDGQRLPLRPDDRLLDDLRIDPDDVEFSLIPEVAKRSGHSLKNPERNPHFGKVSAIRDFVRFIASQPCSRDR